MNSINEDDKIIDISFNQDNSCFAIATENVNAISTLCLLALSKNVIGIITSMNFINNLLKFSVPFWKLVLGFPCIYSRGNFSEISIIRDFANNPFSCPTCNISSHKTNVI